VQVSDKIQRLDGTYGEQVSLQYALLMTCLVCVGGAAFFFAAAVHVQQDRLSTELVIAG